MNFDREKSKLVLQSGLRASKDAQAKDSNAKIAKALEGIPVKEIIAHALYLENNILPEIEKKRGADHANYHFFRAVFKSLLWSIAIIDRYDYLSLKYAQVTLENELLRDRVVNLERQLSKYEALEDLFLTSGLDSIADGIKARANDLLNKK